MHGIKMLRNLVWLAWLPAPVAWSASIALSLPNHSHLAGRLTQSDQVDIEVRLGRGEGAILRAHSDEADLQFRGGDPDSPWHSNSPASDVGTEYLVFPATSGSQSINVTLAVDQHAGGRGAYVIDLLPSDHADAQIASLWSRAARNFVAPDDSDDARRRIVPIEEIRARCVRLGARRCEIEARHALSVLYRGAARFEEAEREALLADSGFEELGLVSGRIASCTSRWGLMMTQGRMAEARAALDRAASLAAGFGQPTRLASIENNLGVMQHDAGDLDAAYAHYARARDLLGDETGQLAILLRNNLGGIHYLRGEPEQAERAFREGIAMAAQDERYAPDRAAALGNLALLQADFGEFEAALAAHGETLAIYRAHAIRIEEARSLSRMGQVLEKLRRFDDAQAMFVQSLALCESTEDVGCASTAHRGLGGIAMAIGAPRDAEWHLRRALALASDTENVGAISQAIYALADLLLDQKRPADALRLLDEHAGAPALRAMRWRAARAQLQRARALIALQRGSEADRELRAAETALVAFGQIPTLASVHLEQARRARAKGDNVDAVQRFERALDNIESMRAEFFGDELRADFFATQSAAYRELAELQLLLFERGGGERWKRDAFATVERARARSLLDALSAREARNDDAATRGLWRSLRAKTVSLQKRQLADDGDDAAATAALRSEIVTLRTALELAEHQSRRDLRLLALGTPRSLQQIQRSLPADTVLLVYQLHADAAWVWRIDPSHVEVTRLNDAGDFDARVQSLRVAIGERRTDFVADARWLHARLIAAARLSNATRRVVIVPDGVLHRLPFAALMDEDGRYLVERHALSALPSASVGLALHASGPSRADGADRLQAVVFADPIFSPDDQRVGAAPRDVASIFDIDRIERSAPDDLEQLVRLPGTADEAQAIREVFGADNVRIYAGADATLDAALAAPARNARILHFGTHGLVDAQAPESTGLVLSRVSADGALRGDDGFLSLPIIQSARYRADLVVLSACDTALGRQVDGEGITGLARAFFAAGARGVLATLWPVPDRAMHETMTVFYRELHEDLRSPADALRAAMREMIRHPRLGHPYNWASLTLFAAQWEVSRPSATLVSAPVQVASTDKETRDDESNSTESASGGARLDPAAGEHELP